MKPIKKYITQNGRRHAVWLDMDEGTVELADMGAQSVPADRDDYRYSRGGGLYQLACELYWKELR
ncbi:MAG: hypothetical protein KKC03_13185 [Bacteroidetes bacterium]|nr:hypothetical protein [Bacteroidota bacterium]